MRGPSVSSVSSVLLDCSVTRVHPVCGVTGGRGKSPKVSLGHVWASLMAVLAKRHFEAGFVDRTGWVIRPVNFKPIHGNTTKIIEQPYLEYFMMV